MLLVLLLHYTQYLDINKDTVNSAPIFSFINIELKSLSFICVNCFILISGYFGIKWKAKSFFNLIYQILFWICVGFVIAKLLNLPFENNFISLITEFFSARWFIPAYLGLYILAPIINVYLEKTSSRILFIYILIFYIYSTLIGYFFISSEFNEGMSIISLVGLYLIGAYLSKTNLKIFKLNPWWDLGIYFLLSMSLTVLNFGLIRIGFIKSPFGYLNPVIILMSIYIFLFFKKINIGYIKWINGISVSVLAIYLFHMHILIQPEYFKWCKIIAQKGWLSFFWLPIYFFGIFFFCISVDKIRILSFNFCKRIISNKYYIPKKESFN